jgi:hypothetical protein
MPPSRRTAVSLLALVALLVAPGLAPAAQIFTDRDLFLAAAGPVYTQTFEGEPRLDGPLPQITMPTYDLVAASDPAALWLRTSPFGTDPTAEPHNTTPGGHNWLQVWLGGAVEPPPVTLTLQYGQAIRSFGLDVTDLDLAPGTLTINGIDYGLSTSAGGAAFFGIVEDVPFTRVDVSTSDVNWGIDDVSSTAAPEPSALVLFGAALLGCLVPRR